MKKMLGGQKFTSDTKVQLPVVVRQWLGQQPASFLHRAFGKTVADGTTV